jgi:hypothetical protein
VISFVQVSHAAFDQGRWVTVGLGSAEGARECAAGALDSCATPWQGQPSAVRVVAESDLALADVARAHTDLREQTR